MQLLLLSNSTLPGEAYLSWPRKHIDNFTGCKSLKTLFIPYAGVTITYDAYTAAVQKALPYLQVEGIHNSPHPHSSLDNAELIIAGGGNTFMLFKILHEKGLMLPLRERIMGGIPFIGWSAGSNLACPGLYTTNDMPIAEPPSFAGLQLISFQINPHFTDAVLSGHGGETRQQRIAEFLSANQNRTVIGLVEGSLISVESDRYILKGRNGSLLFKHDGRPVELHEGDISGYLQSMD